MTQLQADYLAIATFLDALFRYADVGTWIAWRAFRDDAKDKPPVFIEWSQIEDVVTPLSPIGDVGTELATRAARHEFPTVFCPPIATFTNQRAREVDLANGLALSVECDTHPSTARLHLETVLGPATVVVASGGRWTDVHGREHDKLHLHWRLAEPTSDAESHARLKRARILATALVGGDATNVPAVHPIRWPGSWHRKGEPRLATIVDCNEERELVLSDALELLEAAAPSSVRDVTTRQNGAEISAGGDIDDLIARLHSGEAMHAPLVSLAYRFLKSGMADAVCVLTLRGIMNTIPIGVRGGDERWNGHFKDIPRTVRTAREKIDLETPPGQKPDISEFLISNTPPAIVAARKPEVRDIPKELLTPPGVLADVARYGVASAVRPVPIFAVQAALALGSIVCGRRYMTSQRNYSSLYFLNVAKSGTGKEEAKTTIERILAAAGARRLLAGSSYSSGNAVFSALLRKPQHLTIIDEFGKYLEAASGNRDTFKADALTQLMEAFGRVHADMATPQFSTMTLSAAAATNHEPKVIARPAITLLAMTTPSTFYESMRSTRILDGFLNRFLVVEHQGPRTAMVEWKDVAVPQSAVDWIKQILQPSGNIDTIGLLDAIPDPTIVPLTDRAFASSLAFEADMLNYSNRLEADGLGDMPIRAREIALRLALVTSLADAPDTPMVTVDCLDWSIAYVRFFLEQTIAAIRERVADSSTERTRNAVLMAIKNAGTNGVTNRDLHRGKAFIGIPRRDRVDAIESLIAAELVAWVTVATEHAGRPRNALVAIESHAGENASTTIGSNHLELVS